MAETFTDEDLTSFLDGEADAALAARITAAGETLAPRFAALQVDRAQLAMAMDQLISAAPPYVAPKVDASRGVWKSAAGLAAALVVGAGIGWSVPKAPAEATWTEAVASYQALYITQTLAGAQGGPFQEANLTKLGQTLGVSLDGASDLAPLTFRRAQMLGFEGAPLVQIAYLTDDGVPVALCVLPRDGANKAPTSRMMMGMAAVEWQKDGFGYLLIGGEDQALIDQAASVARTSL